MNESITAMLKKPGTYMVTQPGSRYYFLAEVDADGNAYQLNPVGIRDGILAADGWAAGAVATPYPEAP